MANSADKNPSKCFSGIVRRLICSGSLPTHPSDEQNPEEYSMEHVRAANMKVEAASTPGVVARLMGLDSFPSSPFLAPKDNKTLGSFFRSRSVNSIDFLSHFDPIIIKQGRPHHHHHRRVRTSVSFREGINDNFSSNVILRLEETAEVEQPELLITRKTSPDINYYQHSKTAKGDRIRNRKKLQEKRVGNKPSKKVEIMNEKKSSQNKVDLHAKTRDGLMKERRQSVISRGELRKNSKGLKTKQKMVLSHEKVHSGCRMKRVHPQGTVVLPLPAVCSRNNAASKIVKSERSPCSSGGAHNGEIRAITYKGKNERKMKSKESCYYKRMAEEICRLADEDVKENWMQDGCDNFEDMCHHFGQEILQVLLQQFVDELITQGNN
ncbi:hypothetical protein ACP275_12G177700 [Erythranthe tilingii]